MEDIRESTIKDRIVLAVVWIDWYSYHIARFRALARHPLLENHCVGIELVGGSGVHGSLVFRASERDGLPIQTLVPEAGWSNVGQLRVGRRLLTELNLLNPEVILIPGYYTIPALAAVLWARRHKKRTVLMSESTRQDHPRKPYLEWAKRTILPRLFDTVVAGGKRQIGYMRELGFADSRIARNYDVVDNDYFAAETERLRAERKPASFNLPDRYFLYVGRLAAEKNLDGLLREFSVYQQRGGTWSLVLVGDGPMATALGRTVAEKDLGSSVVFAGLQDTRGMLPYYAFAGCFILPSWREPWGLVVNEAMSSRLPVILSDRCGCAEDLLHCGLNGYVFDPSVAGGLAQLMATVSGLDEPERRALGQRSSEIISGYSLSSWAEEVVRIANITSGVPDPCYGM
jgi:glycosyltransferase involved in cell wall biosynthesis